MQIDLKFKVMSEKHVENLKELAATQPGTDVQKLAAAMLDLHEESISTQLALVSFVKNLKVASL